MKLRWLLPVICGIIALVAAISHRDKLAEAFDGGTVLLRDELTRLSEP